MEQEHFHGYEILSEPGHHGNGDEVHWFNVDRQGSEVYRLEMRIARLYARRQSEFPSTEGARELAALLGRRWIHGLIQLGQFERGKTYHLQRGTEWDPLFGEDSVTDDDLRLELLKALQRMERAQAGTGAILTLDGAGIADVLGLKLARLEGVLGELELEGLVSSESAEFNEPLSQLSVSITDAGLRSLRQAEQAAGQPATLVTVDDVDSFAAVRGVRVEEVADL